MMGKANEIIQWILIGLLIVYAIALPIVLYKVGMIFVQGQVNIRMEEVGRMNLLRCEVKEDCSYGEAERGMDSPELFGILGADKNYDDFFVTITGCVNREKADHFTESTFEGECVCISGQCGWIK